MQKVNQMLILLVIFSVLQFQVGNRIETGLDNRVGGECGMDQSNNANGEHHPYVGMWVTKDGYIRHELLPGGRYDEARGDRKGAYKGRYLMAGDHIEYVDDTGFTADGDFRNGILYHAGMILYREE